MSKGVALDGFGLNLFGLQFGGLLSGLYEQTEITDLLDELYYEGLM
jgi:hypothetical protein